LGHTLHVSSWVLSTVLQVTSLCPFGFSPYQGIAWFASLVQKVWITMWVLIHAEDAVGIHLAVRAKRSIGMHWGELILAKSMVVSEYHNSWLKWSNAGHQFRASIQSVVLSIESILTLTHITGQDLFGSILGMYNCFLDHGWSYRSGYGFIL
jgi:hypothetical protein